MDAPRHAEHLLGVELDHLPLFVLAVDGEEVQQLTDMALARFDIAAAARGLAVQVVGELLEDGERARRVEVEDVGVLLARVVAAAQVEQARVLAAEGRLHVQCGARHVREHEHGGPLRHGHARGQLADRKGDGPVVVLDRAAYLVERFLVLVIGVDLAVASSEYHLVILEDGVRLQLLGEGAGGVDAVEHPERVTQLVAQPGCRERELLLRGERVEELIHVGVVHEAAVVLGREELVEVEGELGLLAINLHAAAGLLLDDVAHLVGEQVELGEVGVGVRLLRVGRPVTLGLLLVGIGPVVDGVVGELLVCDGLEGRAGEVQREAALDVVECHVGLEGVHALVCLVDDEHVPGEVGHLVELLVHAAEADGALEVLKAHELDEPLGAFRVVADGAQVLLAAEAVGLAGQSVHAADEAVAALQAHELHVVVVPGVGDGRAVGDDEHLLRADTAAQVVCGERLAEARLGVPQELAAVRAALVPMGAGEGSRLLHCALLLGAQGVGGSAGCVQHAVGIAEPVELLVRFLAADPEPFLLWFALDTLFLEVCMEVSVVERARAVLPRGVAAPLQMPLHVGGVRLLFDSLAHVLLGVADLGPAVVADDLGRGVGIDLRHRGSGGLDDLGDVDARHC